MLHLLHYYTCITMNICYSNKPKKSTDTVLTDTVKHKSMSNQCKSLNKTSTIRLLKNPSSAAEWHPIAPPPNPQVPPFDPYSPAHYITLDYLSPSAHPLRTCGISSSRTLPQGEGRGLRGSAWCFTVCLALHLSPNLSHEWQDYRHSGRTLVSLCRNCLGFVVSSFGRGFLLSVENKNCQTVTCMTTADLRFFVCRP